MANTAEAADTTEIIGTTTEVTTAGIVETATIISRLTAKQIAENCPANLIDLGKRIAVHLEKAATYQNKTFDHLDSAAQLLAEAEAACDKGGFDEFRKRCCPNLGRSRAYHLLSYATGRKSPERDRAENAERNRAYRANKKAAEAVHHVMDSIKVADDRAVQPKAQPAASRPSEGVAEVPATPDKRISGDPTGSPTPENQPVQAAVAEIGSQPGNGLVTVRWDRSADVVTICRAILGTLKYEPHTSDIEPLKQALLRVIGEVVPVQPQRHH